MDFYSKKATERRMRVLIQRVIKTGFQRIFAKGWFYDVVKMKFPFGISNSKRGFEQNINGCCYVYFVNILRSIF